MRTLPLALLLAACHPLSLYRPPSLPKQLSAPGTKAPVEILVDDRGVPHIYGSTLPDVAYGLGFMHARDRLFQIILLRHASQGRLTELFGADMLQSDRRLRLVSWGLDVQLNGLAENDRRVLDAYADGLNAGAKHVGRSAEMAVLRIDAPTFTARDSLGILRLQAWQLAVDHRDELVRHRILQLLSPDDPRRAFLDAPVSSGGVSITGSGDGPVPLSGASAHDGAGASNSWAVDAAHTASGHAVLSNDPHLAHSAPGVFYLAHLETPDFMAAGATLPGGPLVVIGFGRHIAWGMTTSYADAQDLMQIQLAPGRDDAYLLDGEVVPFETVEQTYVIGKQVRTETWRVTRFGPLLPDGYTGARADDPLALAWGASVAGGPNAHLVTGFLDLARAKNAEEAGRAVENMRSSGQNVLLAFTDGTIAYRLAAFAPLRPPTETGRLPRDGSKSANGFAGFLGLAERPAATSPPSGYLVAANQRVVGDADPRVGSVGSTAVPPSRARRIHQRIDALLAKGKPTVDELLAIQQDTVSPEGRELAAALGALCPQARHAALCGAVRRFDGDFKKDSWGALPYTLLLDAVSFEVVRSLGVQDSNVAQQVAQSIVIRNAVGRALLGPGGDVLVDRALVDRAADEAMAELTAVAGPSPSQWRYGKVHTLQPKGALAKAPLVGSYFVAAAHEEAGDATAIRAEDGVPVSHGACLRMIVELSDPPVARLTVDTGQSGHVGDPHFMDQYPDWSEGTPRVLPTSRADVDAAVRARIQLAP